MATTTNFGWTTPNDTDLVKDGAAAIRTLGQSIDTSMMDLEGGTTGQILSKTSATDMDFTWINNDQGDITAVTAGTGISGGGTSGAVTVTNSMATTITTAGDLIKGTGSGTFDRLGIGSTGQVLTVAAGAPSWAAVPAAAQNFSLISSAALTGATSITLSGISGKNSLLILVSRASSVNASAFMTMYFNGDTGSNYYYAGSSITSQSSYASTDFTVAGIPESANSGVVFSKMSNAAGGSISGGFTLNGCNSAGLKTFIYSGASNPSTGTDQIMRWGQGYYDSASTISSVTITSSTGNLDLGYIYVYGSA